MPYGLPRKIELAFVAQGLLAGIAIFALILISALMARQLIVRKTVAGEAAAFWSDYAGGDVAGILPHGSTLASYFVPAGRGDAVLPVPMRGLAPGDYRDVPGFPGRIVHVQARPQGRLVIAFDTRLIDRTILWFALGAATLSVLAAFLMSKWTYRTTRQLVGPVSWLADIVKRWDPLSPDTEAIRIRNLPPESGREVWHLARALTGLADRVASFVQRERDFTRDASHELRTPLTVIRVATDLLMADPDVSPRQLRSLQRMQRAGRDMEAVIDAFLILAREAEIEPVSEEIDVREVVAHEVDRVQPLLAGRPVQLTVIDEGVPELFAPPHVLAVMLGNLLGNAVRFTDEGSIVLHHDADRIEVRDTGIGMAPDILEKAFDPFYRADRSRELGRGMGLSIVRRLGERFGWPVTLRSTPGEGTTAIIHFRPVPDADGGGSPEGPFDTPLPASATPG